MVITTLRFGDEPRAAIITPLMWEIVVERGRERAAESPPQISVKGKASASLPVRGEIGAARSMKICFHTSVVR